jgi:hypothetical protein
MAELYDSLRHLVSTVETPLALMWNQISHKYIINISKTGGN